MDWDWQLRFAWGSGGQDDIIGWQFHTPDGSTWIYVGQVLPVGEWYHVAASHDGETVLCYLDGVETDSAPMTTITNSPSHLLIGTEGWGFHWIGGIDEVALYDRGLSDEEVLYLAGLRPNLVLNPSFEEDDVVLDDPDWYKWCTWNDVAGAGSNATIVDTDAIHGTKSLRIEPIGIENWHFIVANISFPLNSGMDYTTTFWAKAEADRPFAASMKAADNSVSWGYTDFALTTEWAQFSMTSTSESEEGKLEFLCAGSEVPFLLDLVSVR
ncbi:LamG-like jellyroll fold domain-containing protein [Planctomycetota bacterium]